MTLARALPAVLLLALGSATQAQDTAASGTERTPAVSDRGNQRTEHIRIEDAGSRIDEVRIGGQTRSITVQPKAPVPAYDIRPAGASPLPAPEAGPGSAGVRTWKILRF